MFRDLGVCEPEQVWAEDTTHIRLRSGFVYLAAVMECFRF